MARRPKKSDLPIEDHAMKGQGPCAWKPRFRAINESGQVVKVRFQPYDYVTGKTIDAHWTQEAHEGELAFDQNVEGAIGIRIVPKSDASCSDPVYSLVSERLLIGPPPEGQSHTCIDVPVTTSRREVQNGSLCVRAVELDFEQKGSDCDATVSEIERPLDNVLITVFRIDRPAPSATHPFPEGETTFGREISKRTVHGEASFCLPAGEYHVAVDARAAHAKVLRPCFPLNYHVLAGSNNPLAILLRREPFQLVKLIFEKDCGGRAARTCFRVNGQSHQSNELGEFLIRNPHGALEIEPEEPDYFPVKTIPHTTATELIEMIQLNPTRAPRGFLLTIAAEASVEILEKIRFRVHDPDNPNAVLHELVPDYRGQAQVAVDCSRPYRVVAMHDGQQLQEALVTPTFAALSSGR